MPDTTNAELLRYFHRLYKSCEDYIILEASGPSPGYTRVPIEIAEHSDITTPEYNTEYAHRHQIINAHSSPEDNYLEIGVEYGYTFCHVHCVSKTGVDPSPKMDSSNKEIHQIQRMTSDMYFEQTSKFVDLIPSRRSGTPGNIFSPIYFRKYDVVFIDGMHQTEYVLRDLNNAVKYLSNGGRIFIDDILPRTEKEQLKIPDKHYYEDGVLKYAEAWTGDVWKVVYYLLRYYNTCFRYKWFHHPNYRGVILLYSLKPFSIPDTTETLGEINGYEYLADFPRYMDVLTSLL